MTPAEPLKLWAYDPRWVGEFEAERTRLAAELGSLALRIDHHGSTSVPGLSSKPVIDIQISVANLQPMTAYGGPLTALGYTHHPHPDDSFAPFFHKPETWPHSHHVHVVVAGGEEERRTLAFRDYLREHAGTARDYEALKMQLAPRYSSRDFGARQAYADAKGEFIRRVTDAAIREGHPRSE